MIKIKQLKPKRNKILVKQVSTIVNDLNVGGIYIPQTSSNFKHYETLGEVIAIGDNIIDNNNTYLDPDFNRRKKCTCKIGDIVKMNFASIDYVEASDDDNLVDIYKIFNVCPTRISVVSI